MYADTDSLHLNTVTLPAALEIHPSKLGAWKHEMTFIDAMYVRSKFYLEVNENGEYENHVAGLPGHAASLLTFDDIWEGHVLNRDWIRSKNGDDKAAKLRPTSVPGGIVLIDNPFTVKL